MSTERAGIPELVESQAGAYTTINEAFRQVEGMLVGGVVDKDLTSDPVGLSGGEVYIVGSGASGLWSGHDNELAHFYNGAWYFYIPKTDWRVFVSDEQTVYKFNGTSWAEFSAGGGRQYIAMSDAPITLTATEANKDIIDVYGTNTAARTLEFPIIEKTYVIANNTTGGFDINVKNPGGSLITIPNGHKVVVYSDGTNLNLGQTAFPYGIKIGGVINPPLYTVAGVPSAASNYGAIIGVTNGNAGALCLAVSDGGTWKRIALGATISAT